MKTLICDKCGGNGRWGRQGLDCYRCLGQGVLNEDRIKWLRDDWLAGRLASGKCSRIVYQRDYDELTHMLNVVTGVGQYHISPKIVKAVVDDMMKFLLEGQGRRRNGDQIRQWADQLQLFLNEDKE